MIFINMFLLQGENWEDFGKMFLYPINKMVYSAIWKTTFVILSNINKEKKDEGDQLYGAVPCCA